MRNREYRLECVNRDGTQIGGLDDAVLTKVNWTLNAPGSISYSLSQNSKFVNLPQENKNEVQLWIGDDLMHWCFHHKSSENSQVVTFDCPSLLQYFNFRFILNTSLEYDDYDQFLIGASIITDMQALTGQSWNISIAPYDNSGVVRSRKYDILDHQNALDMLNEFPTLTDAAGNHTGFDFDIDVTTIPGKRDWTMYYPYKGTTHPNLVLEYGRNVTDYTVNTDGSSMGNNCYMTGGSNGDIKFENHYKDSVSIGNPLAGDYGEWQAVKSKSGENDVGVLLELAQGFVTTHNKPVKSVSLTSIEVPDELLGVVGTGDTVRVQIDKGRTQIDDDYRINTIDWLPGPGNLKLGFVTSK